MKFQIRITALLIILVVIGASQDWQSANLLESGASVSASGFTAFPQIGLVIAIQLLIFFGARYWSKWPAVVATSLAAVLSLLALSSIFGVIFESNLNLISAKVAAATGIADWSSQQDAIHNNQTNHLAIWLTLVASSLLVLWSLRAPFVRRAAKPSTANEWLN